MHQNRLTGAQECVAHRTYPNALDASIMQAGGATPHERACGKWIDAVGSVTAVSSWSFYDDLGWRAAVLEAEADQGGGERLGADDIGKFEACARAQRLQARAVCGTRPRWRMSIWLRGSGRRRRLQQRLRPWDG